MASLRAAAARRTHTTRTARLLSSFLTALSLSLFLCSSDVSAQDKSAATQDEVVRIDTDLVSVPVYVTDGRGRRVAGLRAEDFEVRDNGRRVEVAYFAAGAERVALLFLLDASGSTRDIITQQRETALALFSRFGARSRVAVMQFRERPELSLPFTDDLRRARAAFRIEALPDRRTAIFDAALAAVRAFRRGDAAERRIVVLVSDGLDTASALGAAAAIKEAEAAGVSFYCIHLPLFAPRDGRLAPRRPSKGFRELAEKTGGQFFTVGDASSALDPRAEYDLRPIFRAIAEDLSGQYVLGYHPDEETRRAASHKVEVRLAPPNARKLRVRQLRESYQAEARP